jgi:DNA-binding LacI/PurR family transcriptional regulator
LDIAIVTGRLEASSDSGRFLGYRRALRRRGIDVNPQYSVCGDLTFEGGRRVVQQLLKLPNRPTAIFVTNNEMTIGALVAISDAGLSLPKDISLLGFDDMDWYRIAKPSITAVRQPPYDMGRLAAERLLASLRRKRQSKPKRWLLNAELIIRESTAAPPWRSRAQNQKTA